MSCIVINKYSYETKNKWSVMFAFGWQSSDNLSIVFSIACKKTLEGARLSKPQYTSHFSRIMATSDKFFLRSFRIRNYKVRWIEF